MSSSLLAVVLLMIFFLLFLMVVNCSVGGCWSTSDSVAGVGVSFSTVSVLIVAGLSATISACIFLGG